MRYRTRLISAALALLLALTAACSGPEPPPPTTTSEPAVAAPVLVYEGQARPVIPLSYSIRQAQQATADALRLWWNDAQLALFGPPYPMVPNSAWAIGNERFGDGSGLDFEVQFHWRGFTPESSVTYGAGSESTSHAEPLPGNTYLIDNTHGTATVPFQRTVSVTYGQSATAELDVSIEIDSGVEVGARVGNPTTPLRAWSPRSPRR